MLRPPDLRDWIPEGRRMHFIPDAMNQFAFSAASTDLWSEMFAPSAIVGIRTLLFPRIVFVPWLLPLLCR